MTDPKNPFKNETKPAGSSLLQEPESPSLPPTPPESKGGLTAPAEVVKTSQELPPGPIAVPQRPGPESEPEQAATATDLKEPPSVTPTPAKSKEGVQQSAAASPESKPAAATAPASFFAAPHAPAQPASATAAKNRLPTPPVKTLAFGDEFNLPRKESDFDWGEEVNELGKAAPQEQLPRPKPHKDARIVGLARAWVDTRYGVLELKTLRERHLPQMREDNRLLTEAIADAAASGLIEDKQFLDEAQGVSTDLQSVIMAAENALLTTTVIKEEQMTLADWALNAAIGGGGVAIGLLLAYLF